MFVLKTTCKCSSGSKGHHYSEKNFFRNKAVSDGAISFYLDHFVRSRVSKFTYGTFYSILYDPNDPDHQSRSYDVFTDLCGEKLIDGFFDIILPKVSCVILSSKVCHLKKMVEYPSFGDDGIPTILFLVITRFC